MKTRFLLLPIILFAAWSAMMMFGTGAVDLALLKSLYSADQPWLRQVSAIVTMAGEWPALVLLCLGVGIGLSLSGQVRTALLFLFVTMAGRLLVHLQKVTIGRLRPEELDHLVVVKSLSFPSGHAGNSMIVFLAMALLVAPERHRAWAVGLALVGTAIVGLSRPMLGVHWPSDVIGGWSFGAAWVVLMTRAFRR